MGIAIFQIYITRENPHKVYVRCFNPSTSTETTWTQLTNNVNTVTNGLEVNGTSKLNGNLEVNGNITQKGSSYITHAEEVKTKKDNFTMREGATSGLTDTERAGVIVEKYNGTTDGHLCIDNTGTARVGDLGDEQPLCTRAESGSMSDGKFVKWNSTSKRIETSDESIATINDSSTSEASAYSSKKTNTQIDNLTRLFGTCNNEATAQHKSVTISNISSSYIKVGREINVMFTKGSTYYYIEGGTTNWGQCPHIKGETGDASATNASNTIERNSAPTLSVNGSTAYPITVGGEYAGEGFVNPNEVHTLVLVQRSDGYAWEDLTANNIYCNKTRNYSKKRDGFIEQWGKITATGGTTRHNLCVAYSNADYTVFSIMNSNDFGNAHTSYMYGAPVSNGQIACGAYERGNQIRFLCKGY